MQTARENLPPAFRLNGETQVFFIIGDPVAQVKSPGPMTDGFAARGANAVMVPAHIRPAGVAAFMDGIATMHNAVGLIATVPHKQAMLGFCARVTERARYAGSVNVMRRTADGWAGDMTDGRGHVDGILAAGGTVEAKRVLLVGAGGAGSAIAYEFLARGAAHLAITDIDAGRCSALIDRLTPAFPGRLTVGSTDPRGFDIVANATPLGMGDGDPLPVEVDKLHAGQFASCVVTRPEVSPFIAAARAAGCRTMTGIDMFKAQEGLLVDTLLTLQVDQKKNREEKQ